MKFAYLALLGFSVNLYASNDLLERTHPHDKLDLGNGVHVLLERPARHHYTLSLVQPGAQARLLWDTARDRRPEDEDALDFSGIEAGIKEGNWVSVMIGAHVGPKKLLQFDLSADHPFIRADDPGGIFSGFAGEARLSRLDDSPVKVIFDSPRAFRIESKNTSILELPPLRFTISPDGQFFFNGNAYDPFTTSFLNIYSTLLKRPLSHRWTGQLPEQAEESPSNAPAIPQAQAPPSPTPVPPAGLRRDGAIRALTSDSRPPERKVGISELTWPRVLCLAGLILLIGILWVSRFNRR